MLLLNIAPAKAILTSQSAGSVLSRQWVIRAHGQYFESGAHGAVPVSLGVLVFGLFGLALAVWSLNVGLEASVLHGFRG